MFFRTLFLLAFFIHTSWSMNLDQQLALIISVYELQSKDCTTINHNSTNETAVKLGQTFFEKTVISGKQNMSCSVCHIDELGSADGIPLAVGTNGEGASSERYTHGAGALVQRNALSLIGRSNNDFKAFFWDGKVEAENNFTVSQFGEHISKVFESPLAVAAIQPILERDELMGDSSILFKNEIANNVGEKLYQEKYKAASEALRDRIFSNDNQELFVIRKQLKSLGVNKSNFEIAHIGNFLAAFIEKKFTCSPSRFDKYVAGNQNALNDLEKKGMVLFYGKGRCASCHAGNLFSDFRYHSIGAPQGYFGPHTRHRDIGRAGVTNQASDLYKFRTPPLIEVSQTAPYGHNGAFKTLREVIIHHFNPIDFYVNNPTYRKADYFTAGKLSITRDLLLGTIDLNNESELIALLAFLNAL